MARSITITKKGSKNGRSISITQKSTKPMLRKQPYGISGGGVLVAKGTKSTKAKKPTKKMVKKVVKKIVKKKK